MMHLRQMACACLALTAFVAPSLAAQGTVEASGRVARLQGGDTVGVADVRVVLHRIGKAVQGPVDSVRTDALGRFTVRFPRDTTALHLLSARNAGIEYFSAPLAVNPERPDTALVLMVHDTSLDAPVVLDGRNIVISRPGDDGARRVLELLVLRNAGDKARVAPDTVRPSWSMRLPSSIVGFSVGPGDISSEAVLPRGDSVLVFAPLAPGDKQLVYEYAVPGDRDRITLPFSVPVRGLTLLVEEGTAKISGLTLEDGATDTVQGKAYTRYSGSAKAGDEITVLWPDPRAQGRLLLGALVSVVAIAVAFLTLRAVRQPRRSAPVPMQHASVPTPIGVLPPVATDLIEQLAALDAAHAGRQAALGPDVWEAYLAARERLLAAALGAPPTP